MEHRIGELAGKVHSFLEEEGEASLSKVSRSVEGPRSKVDMAIGWLAREDNLEFVDVDRGTRVRLC